METMLTDANFEAEVLKDQGVVFVDFWAPWCGPCQQMNPIVEQVAEELNGKVKIGKLNVDENQNASMQYGVMSIPTFILFKNGQKVDQTIGGMPKEKLKAFIEKHLA